MIESIVPTQTPGRRQLAGSRVCFADSARAARRLVVTRGRQQPNARLLLVLKVATASEPSSYDWSFAIAPVGAALYMEITPGNPANPLVLASSRSL